MNMSTEEIVTELSMAYSFKMHLILEGDDDRKFFQAALNGKENINFICAWGSDNVVEIIKKVDLIRRSTEFTPTLGIIDRDYRIPLGTLPDSPNVVISDARDIECMMFDSPSLNTVLAEFGSERKIASLGGAGHVARTVRTSGLALGLLRFYSLYANIGTSFQDLDLSRLIEKSTLAINPSALIAHLNARQRLVGCVLPKNAFELAKESSDSARCDKGIEYFQNELLLCRGHDLMEILAIGFRSLLGSRSAAESSRENVESLFRLSYIAHFRATPMATSIKIWLIENGVSPHVSLV